MQDSPTFGNVTLGTKSISIQITKSVELELHDTSKNPPQLSRAQSFYQEIQNIEADSVMKFVLLLIVAAGIILSYTIDGLNYYHSTSIIMSSIYIQWLFSITFELYKSDSLCAIRVLNTKIDGFGIVTFPTQFIQLFEKPMCSISEFAGVRGGTIHLSMLFMSVCNSLLFIRAILQRRSEILSQNDNDNDTNNSDLTFKQHVILITCIFSAIGFLFVGYFDLNGHSKVHRIMHFFGVFLIFFLTIGFGMIMNFNPLFLCFAGISLPSFVIYWVLTNKYGRKVKNNAKRVHNITVGLILLEVVWNGLAAAASCITVYHLDTL